MEQSWFAMAVGAGLVFGFLIAWVSMRADRANIYARGRIDADKDKASLEERIIAKDARLQELQQGAQGDRELLEQLRDENANLRAIHQEYESRVSDIRQQADEKLALVNESQQRLVETLRGGTTTVWGGRCAPFDPIDFERRPHVPHSGWPVSRADLDPYYARAHVYCDVGRYTYEVADALPRTDSPLLPGFKSDDVLQDKIWRFSLPSNFAKLSPAAFKESGRVRVYLHANCLQVLMSKEGNPVAGLRVRLRKL